MSRPPLSEREKAYLRDQIARRQPDFEPPPVEDGRDQGKNPLWKLKHFEDRVLVAMLMMTQEELDEAWARIGREERRAARAAKAAAKAALEEEESLAA